MQIQTSNSHLRSHITYEIFKSSYLLDTQSKCYTTLSPFPMWEFGLSIYSALNP
jgi:hypothetical protein